MGIPQPPAVDVTSASTPDTILTQVNEAIDYVTDCIQWFLEDVSSFLVDNADIIGGILGGIGGFFLGNEIEERYGDFCDDVWEGWRANLETLRQAVGGFFGDPLLISQIASNYRDAIRSLSPSEGTNIADINLLLDQHWSGEGGYASYKALSDKQHTAMATMQDKLLNAADLLDDNCKNLIDFWIDTLNNLIGLGTNFINKAGKLGDVGNWFSFGAGVVVETIGSTIEKISGLVTTFLKYWTQLNIGSAGDWDGLEASFSNVNSGWPNAQWPDQGPTHQGINDPWQVA